MNFLTTLKAGGIIMVSEGKAARSSRK